MKMISGVETYLVVLVMVVKLSTHTATMVKFLFLEWGISLAPSVTADALDKGSASVG